MRLAFFTVLLMLLAAPRAEGAGRLAKKKAVTSASKRARVAPAPLTTPETAPAQLPDTAVDVALTKPSEPEIAEPFAVPTENAINVTVDHVMTVSGARERIEQLLNYWSHRFGIKSEWLGNRVFLTGSAWGFDIQARFEVGEHSVVAMAADPGSLMRNRATNYVQNKLKKYLHPLYEEP